MMDRLYNSLLEFIKKQKSEMTLRRTSDSEFWLESSDGFLSVKFDLVKESKEIQYDIYSPRWNMHLKEETLKDVERLDAIAEGREKWDYEKIIEDLWLVIDFLRLWGRRNDLKLRETHLF